MASFYNPEAQVVPYQMLPVKKKNDEWKKQTVDAYISKFYFGNNNNIKRRQQMKIAYDLYNSIFDERDLKYVTDPFKVNDSFPATLQNYNIIKPKIDLLMGEETKRPFSFKVAQTNEEATTVFQDKQKDLILQTLMEIAQENPNEPANEEELDRVMKVSDFMHKDYSDIAETVAYHTLNYLFEKENMKYKFMEGFHDLTCAALEVFYTGQINGEPIMERVNPLYFGFDYSPEVKFIEDGEWAVRRMRMTPTAIYDRFYDMMDEKDLKTLIETYRQAGYESKRDSNAFNHIRWRNIPMKGYDDYDVFTGNAIDVWHVTWKSYKKVGFVSYSDPDTGEVVEDVVDESYIPQEGEDVIWDWVIEVWEGYRIGDGIYVGIQPVPEQSISVDNPNSAKLPYVGIIFNNNNTAPRSLVEIMKPLQYMYIVIWYRLELAIARDKGKIINMDVTQIPKSMGVDVNKWLHYLSSAGVNLINPYEDGWDIPGREGGKASAFNQFGQVDLTMSNVIAEYINLMDKIEEMIGELSGVSRQRQGQVQSSELVGNVQQTIVQSSHITESLFFAHNQVKRRVLTNLLNIAKNVWHDSGKTKLNYITDDMNRVFLDIQDDFWYSDFDIFVTDSTEENMNLQLIKNLYQPAMQNGAQLSEIAEIMSSNNLTEIKNKLRTIEEERAKREQQAQQQQQQTLLQAEQMKKEVAEKQIALKVAEIEQKERDSVRDSETAIEVALIGAENKQVIEASKASLEQSKAEREADLKVLDIEERRRANEAQAEIKRMEAKNKAKQTTTSK